MAAPATGRRVTDRARSVTELFPTGEGAAPAPSARERLKDLRRAVERDLVYGYLLYPWGVRRHRTLNAGADRSQTHLYTAFFRVPAQYDVLLGSALDHVGVSADGRRDEPLRVAVLAGSIGAEVWTLAAVLGTAVPHLRVEIDCSDLHPETVDQARRGEYDVADVLRGTMPAGLVDTMFVRHGDRFVVRDELRDRVRFFTADIVNDDLTEQHRPADLVFVQNVLCHLDADLTATALANVLTVAKPRSVVFLDGTPVDRRQAGTRLHGLVPLDERVWEIHRQARRHIPAAWWTRYYGLEPYLPVRDRVRRYATVFTRNDTPQDGITPGGTGSADETGVVTEP